MDQDVAYRVDKIEEPLNSFVSLPTELIVFILSFVACSRDMVKLRYVSRRLRNVCEAPSLWRQFVWPHFDNREYRCVKNALKSCGQYISHLSFPHHVTPSKLMPMLKYCNNLVELRLSTRRLSCDQLEEAIQSMGKLQTLDILWTSEIPPILLICNRLKELTIRKQHLRLTEVLNEWAIKGFVPITLNIFCSIEAYTTRELAQQWLSLKATSPTAHTSFFKVYGRCKVPMDLSPLLPDCKLQFGQSCTLPYVHANKYGLLGLEMDCLLLTDCINKGKTLSRAKMTRCDDIDGTNFSDISSLTFITHFDASYCWHLHSGHLEQLAMACPNLLELNLRGNRECLKRLQGLRLTAAYCKNLQGLNLLNISVNDVENQVQLWEIIAELNLTYLAINSCVLMPGKVDEHTKEVLISLYQKCVHLKALEFGHHRFCDQCETIDNQLEFVLLSNFTSLIHLFVNVIQPSIIMKAEIFSGCTHLKHLILNNCLSKLDSSCTFNCNLEQVYINCDISISDAFMESLSAHGRLNHIILQVGSVSGDGVTALVGNSPELMTCDIVACHISASDKKMVSKGGQLKLRNFGIMLKKRFSNRKLFSCGWYNLEARERHYDYLVAFDNTELASLF